MKLTHLLLLTCCGFVSAQANADTLASGGSSISSTAIIGAGVNTAVAGYMGVKCTSSLTPDKAMYCGFAVLAAVNALNDLKSSSNGSAVTADTTDATTATSTIPGVSTADSGTASKLAAQDNAVIQAAAGKGVTLSSDGSSVNMPDGSSVSASQFGSDANMKANGLNEQQIADLKAAAADVAAKARSKYDVAAMPTESGGGGGSAFNHGANSDDDGSNSKLKSLLSQFNKNRKPASTSGLSKKLGNTGENIGVAGDDIFQMISRQYKRKDSQDAFLKSK